MLVYEIVEVCFELGLPRFGGKVVLLQFYHNVDLDPTINSTSPLFFLLSIIRIAHFLKSLIP